MPTSAKTKAKRTAERRNRQQPPKQKRAASPMNAVELLEQDHREVEQMFDDFEDLQDDNEKEELAHKICQALTVHTRIEEEIFYPAARKATGEDDLLDEAIVEHAGAKRLISEIEDMNASDDLFDAKVKVLGEQIRHHVKEEEEELFPEVENGKMDLDAVGAQMAKRKAALMKQTETA